MPVNSYSQPEVGFVIGAAIGFVWIWRTGPHYGRGVGTANYLFMLICGAIGYGVQLALGLLAGTACVQARGLAPPEMAPAVIGAVVGLVIGIAAVIVQVKDLAFDTTRVNPTMVLFIFGCGGGGMGAGMLLQSIAGEICWHWH